MQPLDIVRHPIVFISIAFRDFLHWYFFEKPVKIIRSYLAYFHACNEICSFVFLLRTLFAPWKQITDPYQTRGFNLSRFAQTLTLNMTTRVIGFLFRITAFVIGIVIQAVLFLVYLAFLLAWLAYPLIAVLGVTYLSTTVF